MWRPSGFHFPHIGKPTPDIRFTFSLAGNIIVWKIHPSIGIYWAGLPFLRHLNPGPAQNDNYFKIVYVSNMRHLTRKWDIHNPPSEYVPDMSTSTSRRTQPSANFTLSYINYICSYNICVQCLIANALLLDRNCSFILRTRTYCARNISGINNSRHNKSGPVINFEKQRN